MPLNVYLRHMQQFGILLFLTSVHFIAPLVPACLITATVTALAVWFICRKYEEKKAAARYGTTKKKLEFLTHLTNELRTPVTLITTPLHKLAGNRYDEDTDKELKLMKDNAEKVLSLLDKTMSVDKLDEDDKSMRFREIDIVKYIRNLLIVFRYPAKLGAIKIDFHSNAESIGVWLDRYRFDRVLMTLIDTFIKATPAGNKMEIGVTAGDKSVAITFSSYGNSIDDRRITDFFGLIPHSDTSAANGANLDLYLCRDIICKHKGTVSVNNFADKKGFVCTIILPLGNTHIPKEQLTYRNDKLDETWHLIQDGDWESTVGDEANRVSDRQYSIIAIDEHPALCRYLEKILSPIFNVATFTDPAKGLNAAVSDTPDLVIAEVMMSEIDGIALVKRLKSNTNTAHIPVLLLTAIPGEEVRMQGLLTGADAIISKPFNEEELILTCNNLIKNRSRLASHIKDMQISKNIIVPVELQSNNDILMQKVLVIINERISDPELNVEVLADKIGISRGHLHRRIKEITGSSPGEYIRAIRLNQAAQLLKGAKKNISQIAYSVGYGNPSVFSTAFKSFFGISAKEYQKRYADSDESREAKTT